MRSLSTVVLLALALAACGGGSDDSADEPAESPSTSTAASEPTETSDAPADPEPAPAEPLSEEQLQAALLELGDMPPGFTKSEPRDDETQYLCDYAPPSQFVAEAAQQYEKNEGLSVAIVSVAVLEYESPADAKAQFDALAETVATCSSDEIDGDQWSYAETSAPKLGEDSIGLRSTATIEDTDVALTQFYVLMGSGLVQVGQGGVGLASPSTDDLVGLTEAQVAKYDQAVS